VKPAAEADRRRWCGGFVWRFTASEPTMIPARTPISRRRAPIKVSFKRRSRTFAVRPLPASQVWPMFDVAKADRPAPDRHLPPPPTKTSSEALPGSTGTASCYVDVPRMYQAAGRRRRGALAEGADSLPIGRFAGPLSSMGPVGSNPATNVSMSDVLLDVDGLAANSPGRRRRR
jgi:hypothetical protein